MAPLSRRPLLSHVALAALALAACAESADADAGKLPLPAAPTPAALAARLSLPSSAAAPFTLHDPASGASLAASLIGAHPAAASATSAGAFYAGALDRADLDLRVRPTGVEDLVYLHSAPRRPEIAYALDLVGGIAGLRLVARTLELLDAAGAPRLRVEPPFLIDATGARIAAAFALEGCAYNTDPRAPWGRPVVAPGASRCTLHVTWQGAAVTYPAVLDPVWSSTEDPTYPHDARGFLAALQDGRVLVAGQVSDGSPTGAELYDPATRTWAATADPSALRSFATATRLPSGKVLVAGGGVSTGPDVGSTETTEIYDPSAGTWAAGPSLDVPRSNHSAATLADGRVLVFGGLDCANASCTDLATSSLYDEGTGAWSATGSLNQARQSAPAVTLANGDVLTAGASTQNGPPLASAELYDPVAGTWSTTGSLATARIGAAMTALQDGGALLAAGIGADNSLVQSAEHYDVGGGTWTTSTMNAAHASPASATLVNGTVLVAAGAVDDAGTPGDAAELYDPSTSLWTVTSNLRQPRTLPLGSLLADGTVLVVGGATTPSAETYGPQLPQGSPCKEPGACVTGYCTDGVCCSQVCATSCGACNLPGSVGTCTAVNGAPHAGHPACPGSGPCGGSCNGSGFECTVPPFSTECAPGSCSAGMATAASTCDGAGTCVAGAVTACAEGCEGGVCTPSGSSTSGSSTAGSATGGSSSSSSGAGGAAEASGSTGSTSGSAGGGSSTGGCGCEVDDREGGGEAAFAVMACAAIAAKRRRRIVRG